MSGSGSERSTRHAALLEACEERILVLDGATGTGLQREELSAADFGGEQFEGCNEQLITTRPDVVLRLHELYLQAGADIVETNTFGCTSIVLAEYGIAEKARGLNRDAAQIARDACEPFDRPGRLRFVCGSMGPTTKAISVTGGVTFDELRLSYREQAAGLIEGGADYLLLETCQDTINIKAGMIGIEEAFAETGVTLPLAVSVTIEATGTMLAGQDPEALAISLLHSDLLYVGLNCATGPEMMTDHVRTISEICRTRIGCVPNAGLPNEDGEYTQSPDRFAGIIERFVDAGWVNFVGGCCGTTDGHVRALVDVVDGRLPRTVPIHQRSMISGIEGVELTDQNRPLLVGERTNVLGSRKFRNRIEADDFEGAAEIGRAQARGGAQVLDVCMQNPDRDEVADMAGVLDKLTRMVRTPLMIDSTDSAVMESALARCQGKVVLNSINLEEGRTRFDEVIPLAQRFGAAVVVGLIDEDPDQGMAVTVERKIEVAGRSYRILTEEYGFPPEDIWFDPLVFPCGTGDKDYLGSATFTIEGVRAVKAEFPITKTILGISNVSFGLPPAGREVVNAVFLHHCTVAGLDAAIVNTERLARFAEIPEGERSLAEKLLFLAPGDVSAGDSAVAEFTEHFRGRKKAPVSARRADLSLAERLSAAIVQGTKEGLADDIDLALADSKWESALEIVNGPLMEGMAEVGRRFAANELIVAEVLQSAEAMKAAVARLEPHMAASGGSSRGKVLLATVKGDVHDIGKNLVDIILTNNGYEVVNLGIKITSERLIQEARNHEPDVIGLSGLLVKSAQQMILTAGDLTSAGIDVPLLVGGAALSRRFTHKRIAPAYGGVCTYAPDAMAGLGLVEKLLDETARTALAAEIAGELGKGDGDGGGTQQEEAISVTRSSSVSLDLPAPLPADCERQSEILDPREVWRYRNDQMLLGKHLGLRGGVERLAARGDEKYQMLRELIDSIESDWIGGGMEIRGVWQFFAASSEGNRLSIFAGDGSPAATWELPRSPGPDGLCLADYVLPEADHVALFVTTAGQEIREQAAALRADGEYLRSHALAALALETAEAAAELVHSRIRASWGFPDSPETKLKDLLAARYRGKRYSFGYPACPDLGGQRALFSALRPEAIGVHLTENDMMDPEASVSALVFHHPEARYFAV